MNKIIELIGKNIQIVGVLLLTGFVATAGVMYFGLPGPTRAKAAAKTDEDCSNCAHHAALKKAEPVHAAAAAGAGCCPTDAAATTQPPAGCPASAQTDAHAGHDHAH